jgi:hypothetical protein
MSYRPRLSDWHKHKLAAIAALGCDRATAAAFTGATLEQLEAELQVDAEFAADFAKAEAQAEVRHMGNIHQAAQDATNWRTSAWWLERRATTRAADATGDATAAHLAELVEDLAAAIVAEVPDVTVQRRLIERLERILSGDDAAGVVADGPPRLPAPGGDARPREATPSP